ncbi:MAG: relaxase domain-containing protein, partial [Actinomycetota bacterium]|nr:relaxase domain-containing protein [Actinomycetota bacterium]
MAKLRVGQEAYQLTGVAQSLDDYYTGVGEAPGVWVGVGAERLGLVGEVNGDDLRAVLAGMAPASGGLSPNGEEIRPHRRRVPGFDLTFKAPKSLSVLYAVSDDPRVQGAIIEAGDAAVRATLGWLEREAVRVRRGTGNQRFLTDLAARDPQAAERAAIRVLPGRGLVAAMFRHRTSRAGDPLLHWHTLVANLVEGPDGRWSAFVHPELYGAVRAAGEVFQTVLRAEVTNRFGLQWRPGRHVGEVVGVPQRVCDRFSKRSAEIEAWLQATGTPNSAEGRQKAVLATRRNKPEVEGERFDVAWKAEALAAGWGPDAAEELLAATPPGRAAPTIDEVWRLPEHGWDEDGTPYLYDRVVDPDAWTATVVRAELTASDATFTKAQLTRAVAARLGDGATVATVERVVARAVASPELVPLVGGTGQRWTSRELVAVEQRFLDAVSAGTGSRTPVAGTAVDQVVAGRPTLGADQVAAVRALTGSGDGLGVLVGPAGTGKTFTLDAVRTVFEAAGVRVVGAAPSARAALELEIGAGIPSMTLHRLISHWRRDIDTPTGATVLVVDEAGMAGVRELECVVSATVAAGGRVILVGDPHQLPEVTAGGGLAAAIDSDATVAELTVNRRQQQPWEREALDHLRNGQIPAAVAAYRDHDRVIVTDDRHAMVNQAAERWIDASREGQVPVLLAGTTEMVDALNQAVRHQLTDRGLLDGDVVGRCGDRVVLRRISYREHTPGGHEVAVLNGQAGTVTGGSTRHLDIALDHDHRVVRLTGDYLQAGWVDHGYALTTHRAQGGTWDQAIAVGLDGLYREAAYVQLSRGAEGNWLIVTAPELAHVDTELDRHDHGLPLPDEQPDDLDTDLQKRLGRSRAKLLALAVDPDADRVQQLAATQTIGALEGRARYARTAERHATDVAGMNPRQVGARLARAQHTATHIAVGQHVKPADRHNIGVVTSIDDTAATVTVQFTSSTGRQAIRSFGWDQIDIVTPHNAEARLLTPDIEAHLATITETSRQTVEAWHAYLGAHRVGPLEAQQCQRAATLLVDRAAGLLTATQPGWLIDMIGTRPERATAAQVWDETVRHIAGYRTRTGITDPQPGLGAAPTPPARRQAWDHTVETVLDGREWLAGHDAGPAEAVVTERTVPQLEVRSLELDALFDTAPADQRPLIAQLRAGDQLPFDNTADILDKALTAQGDRQQWILTHWPHIVEYAEI